MANSKNSTASKQDKALTILSEGQVVSVRKAVAYAQDSEKRDAVSISKRYQWFLKNFTAVVLSDEDVDKLRKSNDGQLPGNVKYSEGHQAFVRMGATTLLLWQKRQEGKSLNATAIDRVLRKQDFKLFRAFLTEKQVESGKSEFTALEAQGILMRALTAKDEKIAELTAVE